MWTSIDQPFLFCRWECFPAWCPDERNPSCGGRGYPGQPEHTQCRYSTRVFLIKHNYQGRTQNSISQVWPGLSTNSVNTTSFPSTYCPAPHPPVPHPSWPSFILSFIHHVLHSFSPSILTTFIHHVFHSSCFLSILSYMHEHYPV